jgi:hypothetical protein
MNRGEAWVRRCRLLAGQVRDRVMAGMAQPVPVLRRALWLAWPGGPREGWLYVEWCRASAAVVRQAMREAGEGNSMAASGERAHVRYVNHRGEESVREILPESIAWGSNEWHPQPQWLLWAWDCGKMAVRTFAMAGIKEWGIKAGEGGHP